MSITLIQDLRWGDTGKGKISEYMSQPDKCDVSVRAVGGGNAGHVIQVGTRKLALHLLPAGCVHEGVQLVLGRGMVTHPQTLLKEIDEVQKTFGSDPLSRLVIAPENHLLLTGHKKADQALEERKGKDAVGTTKSGIGPAYADKALRVGLRMEMLKGPSYRIKDHYHQLTKHWAATYGVELDSSEAAADIEALQELRHKVGDRIWEMSKFWRTQLKANARIVIEGAQGSLLSIDGQGYPYVTSSPTTTAGHMQGAGLPVRELTDVIGTLKAYDTRVGNGPMHTEFSPQESKRLGTKGGEFGSTTGRPRRVGWLNVADAKQRAWEESVTKLAILKGDVLDDERTIGLGMGEGGDVHIHELHGWQSRTRGMQNYGNLPSMARHFYQYIEQAMKKPIRFIGTGPESTELIDREKN
jgi:adenylosuccinate synthase